MSHEDLKKELTDRIQKLIEKAWQRGYDAGIAARRNDRLFEVEEALRNYRCANSGPIRSVGECIDSGMCGCDLNKVLRELDPPNLKAV